MLRGLHAWVARHRVVVLVVWVALVLFRLRGARYAPAAGGRTLSLFATYWHFLGLLQRNIDFARQLGFNTMRVFLHDLLWAQDRQGFARGW